jgi:hypothetical protein
MGERERERELGDENFNSVMIRFDNQSTCSYKSVKQKSVVICCFFSTAFLKYKKTALQFLEFYKVRNVTSDVNYDVTKSKLVYKQKRIIVITS